MDQQTVVQSELGKPQVTLLKHDINTFRDFYFDGEEVLVIREITISPNGVDAYVKQFRLKKPEYIKLAEIVASLVRETRAHIAVAGE